MIDLQIAIVAFVMIAVIWRYENITKKNKKKIRKLKKLVKNLDLENMEFFNDLIIANNTNTEAIREMYPTFTEYHERAGIMAQGLFDPED